MLFCECSYEFSITIGCRSAQLVIEVNEVKFVDFVLQEPVEQGHGIPTARKGEQVASARRKQGEVEHGFYPIRRRPSQASGKFEGDCAVFWLVYGPAENLR